MISFLCTFFWGIFLYFDSGGERDLLKIIKGKPYYGYSILVTFTSFFLLFSLVSLKAKVLRDNTNEIFSSFNNSKDYLYLNQKLLNNDSIIKLFKSIKKESSSRNTGIVVINLKLVHNNENKYFTLLRDFSDSQKYWVEIKKTESEENGFCIGEINTNQFDTISEVDKTSR